MPISKRAITLSRGTLLPVGVVGGGEENELRPFVGGGLYGVEINPVIRRAFELNDLAAGNVGEELVHAERGDATEDSITGFQEETDNHIEDFVGAVADDYVLGGEPCVLGEGGAQGALLGVRVGVEGLAFRYGLEDAGGGAVGVFVGVQLDRGQRHARRGRSLGYQALDGDDRGIAREVTEVGGA